MPLQDWQIIEIEKALGEADHGEFASAEEVAKVMKKWTRRQDDAHKPRAVRPVHRRPTKS
jgi:predicted transcriptional regulator